MRYSATLAALMALMALMVLIPAEVAAEQTPTPDAAQAEDSMTGAAEREGSVERLDQDDDGQLDREELADFGIAETNTRSPVGEPDRAARLMERFDRDKDGAVSKEEFEQGPAGPPKATRESFEPDFAPGG